MRTIFGRAKGRTMFVDKRECLQRLVATVLSGILAFTWARADVLKAGTPERPGGTCHALIIVGLPGDQEHEKRFAETAGQWRDWLTGPLGFAPTGVHVLFGGAASDGVATKPATCDTIEREIAAIRHALSKEDRFWVFLLGHANHDGEHAWLHLPGPDIREDRLAELFDDVDCREEVFWITTSASGWFLRGLSARADGTRRSGRS